MTRTVATRVAILFIAAVFLTAAFRVAHSSPPDIVLILADDLGYGDLGSYGSPHASTPHLDALAAEGLRFTFFTAGSPACSPSRATLLTGRWPWRTGSIANYTPHSGLNASQGQWADWLAPGIPNLARHIAKQGYHTAFFGKWHLGETPDAPPPTTYGFDTSWCVHCSTEPPGWRGDPIWRHHSTSMLVDMALAHLHETGPNFVLLSLLVPHGPLGPPPEALTRPDLDPDTGHTSAANIYQSALEDLDTQIGRLLAGLRPDTLVIFTSDNGPEVPEWRNASHAAGGSPGPFRGAKRSILEGGIRVPFIASWPGVIPPGTSAAMVTAADLRRTISSLAGIPFAGGPDDGEDASPAFLGLPWRRTSPIHHHWPFTYIGRPIDAGPLHTIRLPDTRSRPWKLHLAPDGSTRLHRLDLDPGELNPLDHAHPIRALRMRILARGALSHLSPPLVRD